MPFRRLRRPFGGQSSLGYDTVPRVTLVNPSSGRIAGGLAVTISGDHFRVNSDGTAPTVLFGGSAATSVVVVDEHTITCVTPAASLSGSVDVSVTVESQTGTMFGGFTYFVGVISSIVPAYGPLAGGTVVTIFGFNFVDGSTITFGGTPGTDVTFIDNQTFRVTTPNHAVGFVDVVITEPSLAVVTAPAGFQFTLFVRGEDIRRQPGIVINDTLKNAPNTAKFRIDGDGAAPVYGELIQIIDPFDGDRLLFAGTVQDYEMIYEGQTDQLAWNVSCTDFTSRLNKYWPVGTYIDQSATDVVKDLMARNAPGFNTNFVQANLAKISAVFDGTKDLTTCLSEIANAIGGGHWYADYTPGLHFFHKGPKSIPPATEFGTGSTDHLTVAEGSAIPAVFSYPAGYYFLRHTFVFSDGTESSLGAISNVLEVTGTNELVITDIPLGPNPGALTCVARRLYYTALTDPGAGSESNPIRPGAGKITDTLKFVQVDDNSTTGFTCWFGTQGASSAAVIAIPDGTVAPTRPTTAVPPPPAEAPVLAGVFKFGVSGMISNYAVKTCLLYRDGSVSAPSPISNVIGADHVVQGEVLTSVSLQPPIGPAINGFDVVARLSWISIGYELPGHEPPDGGYSGKAGETYNASGPLGDPFSSASSPAIGVIVTPGNEAEVMAGFTFMPYGLVVSQPGQTYRLGSFVGYTMAVGKRVGGGIAMRQSEDDVLSVDPIPVWPNPDGPDLEDVDQPEPIDDDNLDLLHEDSGSQPFSVFTQGSQIHNRVKVRGARSNAARNGRTGDILLFVQDITQFSPKGGQVLVNSSQNIPIIVGYSGVSGSVGATAITLTTGLPADVTMGTEVCNYFGADDIESQQFLGKFEVDINGKPTDGIHEYTVDEPSMKATFQLFMRAHAELELFARPIVTVKYATRDPKSRSGKTVHIDLTRPPCQGDFLIQSVVIDQIHDESDMLTPRYTVTASSVRFELNDLLLLILGQSKMPGGSGGAGAGAAAAGVSSTGANSGTNSGLDINKRIIRAEAMQTAATTGVLVDIAGTWSLSAGPAAITGKNDLRAGAYAVASISTTAGANNFLVFNRFFARPAMLPKIQYRLLSPTTSEMSLAAGNLHLGFGWMTAPTSAWIGLPSARGIYLLINQTLGNKFAWYVRTIDLIGTRTVELAPLAPDTVYLITIEGLSEGAFKVTVNGQKVTMDSLTFASTDLFGPGGSIQTLTNGQLVQFWVNQVIGEAF